MRRRRKSSRTKSHPNRSSGGEEDDEEEDDLLPDYSDDKLSLLNPSSADPAEMDELRRAMEGSRQSTIVPGWNTHVELRNPPLEPGGVYMVELAATVESSDGELRGEPAVLFIRTGNATKTSSPPPVG